MAHGSRRSCHGMAPRRRSFSRALRPAHPACQRADHEMGPRARLAIAGVYLALQAALVLSAERRPDRAFGFRMAAESSTVVVALSRELRAPEGATDAVVVVSVKDGEWVAHDGTGKPRRIEWRDRVHEPELATFDTAVDATAGAVATVARLQAALDDVATHTPDDTETRALLADIVVQRNGREPYAVHLRSVPR